MKEECSNILVIYKSCRGFVAKVCSHLGRSTCLLIYEKSSLIGCRELDEEFLWILTSFFWVGAHFPVATIIFNQVVAILKARSFCLCSELSISKLNCWIIMIETWSWYQHILYGRCGVSIVQILWVHLCIVSFAMGEAFIFHPTVLHTPGKITAYT